MLLCKCSAVLYGLLTLVVAQSDYESFLSRPGHKTPKLVPMINKNPGALAPGYIFTAPYGEGHGPDVYGPLLHTPNGTLVFDGTYLVNQRAMDPHVCDFKGTRGTHLCFTDAYKARLGKYSAPGPGHSSGHDRIFNRAYKQVGTDYKHTGGLNDPDAHEMNSPKHLGGKAFIQTIYQQVQMDISEYDGPKDGWVLEGCFQQINVDTHKAEFTWCSLPHVPLYETNAWVYGNKAGNSSSKYSKGTERFPWDYFHINSIDRDAAGDYYVSSRTTRTIFKIAGPQRANPGAVIFRLGGRSGSKEFGDFTQLNDCYYASQHHIRILAQKGDITILSVFDNATPPRPNDNGSNGKVLRIDEGKMTVKRVQLYENPEGQYDPTGGAFQILKNGNAFLGFGSLPSLAEYTKGNPGEVIYYAKFAKELKSYRSFKYEWTGEPDTPPDVFAYQQDCTGANLVVYMSWNGATEYKAFRVYGTNTKSTKGGTRLGRTFNREGFETVATIPGKKFYKYVYVKAIGSSGQVLGTSRVHVNFVPKGKLASTCGPKSCPDGTNYTFKNNKAGQC